MSSPRAAGRSSRRGDIDADLGNVDSWQVFYDAWHDYLAGGTEPSFSGRNNLKVFALLSAAIDSIDSGQPAEVSTGTRYGGAYVHAGEWSFR